MNEDLSIADVIAKLRRAAAETTLRVRWAIAAHYHALSGGHFGERDEHVRFLMFFDYTFSKRLMSGERFTWEWPHHSMVPVPGWPEFVQAQN